jgi:hypothetical protein
VAALAKDLQEQLADLLFDGTACDSGRPAPEVLVPDRQHAGLDGIEAFEAFSFGLNGGRLDVSLHGVSPRMGASEIDAPPNAIRKLRANGR